MATARPEIATIEGVVNFYELQGDERTRFAIYAGHKIAPENCRYEYFGTDKNTGAAELMNICRAIVDNPANTNVYILQVLAEEVPKGKVKNPNGSRSVTFQLNNPMPGFYPAQSHNNFNQVGNIGGLAEKLAAISARLDAMQEVDDIDDETEIIPEPANPFMAIFAGLLSNPEIQNKIVSGITGFIEKMTMPNENKVIAGITAIDSANNDKTDLQANIDTIKLVLPDFENIVAKLATMAKENPQQLKTLAAWL
jgi:hypothetical protein